MQIVTCNKCGANNRVDESRLTDQAANCGSCGTPLTVSENLNATGSPVIVTDENFMSEVLQSDLPILVDFWAVWCGPCRIVAPFMDQLAAEANGRYRIGKLNVDENQRTAQQYAVSSIPTMIIFKKGQMVDRLMGAMPKQAIAARLAQIS